MNAIDTKIQCQLMLLMQNQLRSISSLIFDKNSFISSSENQVCAHEAPIHTQKSVNGVGFI
jgi:hypothetical protein